MKNDQKRFYERLHSNYYPQDKRRYSDVIIDRNLIAKSAISKLNFNKALIVGFESTTVVDFIFAEKKKDSLILLDIDHVLVDNALEKGYTAIEIDISEERLSFSNNTFDLIYVSEVIEHLVDPDFAFEEFYRVLTQNGHIIVSTPNLAAWYNRLMLLFGISPINIETSTKSIYGRRFSWLGEGSRPVGHIRQYTKLSLCKFVTEFGFNVLYLKGYSRKDVPFDSFFSKFITLSSGLVLVAGKECS